jgi:thiol-disulfide isomerase/thioredoxin
MHKRRTIALVVAVLIVQLAAVLVYRAVERGRTSRASSEFAYERLDGDVVASDAELETQDRKRIVLSDFRGQSVLVHFWATWCTPCRTELPTLIDYAADTGARVVLVSADTDWDVIGHFFDGKVPPSVVLDASGGARRGFRVSTLPDTYLLNAQGRLAARFHGPRDWREQAARAELSRLASSAR